MMIDKVIFTLRVLIFISLLTLAFTVGYGYGIEEFNFNPLVKNEYVNYDCQYEDLQESIKCLNNDFKTFFVFNLTNTNVTLTEYEFREVGGVCTHASRWYKDKLDNLGFLTQEVTIYPTNNTYNGHRFLIAYDEKVKIYCLVDQLYYNCQRLI